MMASWPNLAEDEPFLANLASAKERVAAIFRNRGLSADDARVTRIAQEVLDGERSFVDVRIALRPYAKRNGDSGIPDNKPVDGDSDADFMVSLDAARQRVRAIFENRGLEADASRINRIANEVYSGDRTFDDVRKALEPYAREGGGSAVSAEVRKYLEESFPSFVWAIDDPELGKILAEAAEEEWSPTRIQAALEGTAWWQETSATAREARLMQENDPAEWQRQVEQRIAEIEDQATALGLSVSRSALKSVAADSLTLGYSPAQLESAIIAHSNLADIDADAITAGEVGGQLSTIERQVEQLAYDWMLDLPDSTKLGWAKKILRGDKTIDSFASYAQAMARKNLPFIADLIDQGLTPEEALSPYRSTIAQQLEIAPASVNFMDGQFQSVLQMNEDGTSRLATMPEVKAMVREKFASQWNRTSNAKQAAAQMTEQLGKVFGRTA